MRKLTMLIAVGLAASTTGCIENMDSGYGGSNGYSGYNGGGYNGSDYNAYNSGYSGYSQPTYYRPAPVNNYYVTPQPQVITNTRYVPVPVPTPAPQRTADHRWDGNRDHNGGRHDTNDRQRADRPQQPATPPAATATPPAPRQPQATSVQSQGTRRGNGTAQDRDGDGIPDSQRRPNRRG